MRCLHCAWLAALALCISAHAAQHSDPGLHDKFLTDAPLVWKKLWDFPLRVEGKFVITRVLDIKNQSPAPVSQRRPDREEVDFLINGDFVRLRWLEERRSEKGDSLLEAGASGLNSRYHFSLRKKDVESPYFIRNVEKTVSREINYQTYAMPLHRYVHAAHTLGPEPLEEFFSRKGVTINSVVAINRGDREFVQVSFGSRREVSKQARHETCRYLFEPSRQWRLCETEFINDQSGRGGRTIEYDETNNDFPFPKMITIKVKSEKPDDQFEYHETIEFTGLKWRTASEAEFTLSAFGLPEADPYFVQSSRLWMWFLAGAILLCVIGGGTIYMKRRRIQ